MAGNMDIDAITDVVQADDRLPKSSSGLKFELHPIVLLCIGDHLGRLKSKDKGRDAMKEDEPSSSAAEVPAFGCLLGEQKGRTLQVDTCFDLPYPSNPGEVDAVLLQKKIDQYKQVQPNIDVLGWYCTGSELLDEHMEVHTQFLELNGAAAFLLLNPSSEQASHDWPLAMLESETHVVNGHKHTVFTSAAYEIVSSEMERIVVNQMSNLSTADDDSGVSAQLKQHISSLKISVDALIERVEKMLETLEKMKDGAMPYNPTVVRSIASFADSLPCADSSISIGGWEKGGAQKDSLLRTLLAAVMAGSVSGGILTENHALLTSHTIGGKVPGLGSLSLPKII